MPRRARIAGGAAIAAATTVVVLFAGVLTDGPSAPGPAEGGTAHGLVAGTRASTVGTEGAVTRLEKQVASHPQDADALAELGLSYEQRARETADPSFYGRAEAALRRAQQLEPRSYEAATGLASLAASRHRFRTAAALARRARGFAPSRAAAYGILGDALVELGRYRAGFAAFDRMAALEPNLAAYTRISYARELLGRPRAAASAMRVAVQAGSASPENVGWTLVQLGNLFFDTGRPAKAEAAYRTALAADPGYAHAQAGLARVLAARGRFDAAVHLLRRAVTAVPLPQYAIALGDTLRAARRPAAASRADGLVDVLERLFAANGARTELETALYDLDHRRNVHDALRRAQVAYRAAPSIQAEDVLAWALYRNGRCDEALEHSKRALRLGTLDALKIFHRAAIERCLGDDTGAKRLFRRALAVNPSFSLRWAPVARRAIR